MALSKTSQIIIYSVVGAIGVALVFVVLWALNVWPFEEDDEDSVAADADKMLIKFVPDSSRSARFSSADGSRSIDSGDQFGGDADRATLDIKKLEYYLLSISFAKDLTLNGSSFSNATNTLNLYTSNLNASEYNSYGFDEASADTTNYVDLLDETALANKLNKEVTITESGEYNFMTITWAQPYKIEATAYNASGEAVMSTKAATANEQITDNGGGGEYTYYRSTVGTMTDDPSTSEKTVVRFNNGGSFLRFAKPLTISADGGPYRIYLVYDPYQSIRAAKIGGESKLAQVVDSGDAWFSATLMNMAAVVCEAGDVIQRSRIRITRPTSEDANEQYDYLLQVYNLKKTPDEIAAVNVGILAKDGSDFVPAGAPQTATSLNEISQATNGTFGFKVWNGDAFISGLDLTSTTGGSVQVYELAGSPQADNNIVAMNWSYIGTRMETFVTAT